MTCVASRSGALENLEITGTLFLLVSDSDLGSIAIKITDNKQAQTSVSVHIISNLDIMIAVAEFISSNDIRLDVSNFG